MMDCIKREDNADPHTVHRMLSELREKATLILTIFNDLPYDCQMDGLLILQDIINHAVNKMTNGKVTSVRFVPCDAGLESVGYIWQVASQTNENPEGEEEEIAKPDVKEEPVETSWTISEVCGSSASCWQLNETKNASSKAKKNSTDTQATKGGCKPYSRKTSPAPSRTIKDGKKSVAKRKNRPRRAKVRRNKQVSKDSRTSKDEKEAVSSPPVLRSSKTKRSGLSAGSVIKESDPADKQRTEDDVDEKPVTEDDKEAVLSMIPLKMRLKITDRRWKPKFSGEVKKFRCGSCSYSTNKRIHLEYHSAIHTGTGKFVCEECGKCFTAASSLRRHVRAHQGIRPFACPICGKAFIDLASVRTHSVVHTGERLFKCDECDKVYTNSANLSRHRRVHTGALPYACKKCDVKYRDLSSLKLHMLKHTGEKPYLCDVCNKQFKTSSDFRRHERTHTGERKYRCSQCGKTFVQGWNLKQHERIHGDIRPWKCHICPKAFRSKYSLDHHLRSHTGVKQYQCKICYKWFTTKKYLSNHQVLHTFAKPFRCSTCGQRFNQFSNLKRHERIHSDERRYKCHVCDKAFKYINSLQYHEGIHTGSRLTCDRCGVSFRCKSSIRRHRCKMELTNGVKTDDDVKVKDEPCADFDGSRREESMSTDEYDLSDRLECESVEEFGVTSTLYTSLRESVCASQRTSTGFSKPMTSDDSAGFSELKVMIRNIRRSEVGRDNGEAEAQFDLLDDQEVSIGNVISVSISDSDGVAYPSVVIKQEVCDFETEILSAVAESGLG